VAKKGHSEEQMLRELRQAESGTRVADICRELGRWTETVFALSTRRVAGLMMLTRSTMY
jgi:hypothetical protein